MGQAPKKYERATQLLEADVGAELVALDAERGNCFGFNESATVIWRLLERPYSIDEITDALLDRFEVGREECREEVGNLLEKLEAAGLVRQSI